MQKSICVFGSSNSNVSPQYAEVAIEVGRLIALNNWTLICGGANSGLMERLAWSVQQSNGSVVAIIPQIMVNTTYVYDGADEIIVTKDLLARKSEMVDRSEAFIVLPGGLGTLDEAINVLALKQLGMHDRSVTFVNTQGYYNKFEALLVSFETEHFIGADEIRYLFSLEPTPESAIEHVKQSMQL